MGKKVAVVAGDIVRQKGYGHYEAEPPSWYENMTCPIAS